MNAPSANAFNEKFFEPRPVPNFLIVGAARAGTTSVWQWLRQHPEVFLPNEKEPAFFVHNNFGVYTQERYLALFKEGRGKPCIGEASTTYLACPESAAWIRQVLGQVKIVIILRNPVERAYSMYCWLVMNGLEPLETFEEALEQESRRMNSLQFYQNCPINCRDYFYFHAGLYVDRIKPYIDAFGREQVKVLLFDDLKGDSAGFCADLCRFLGISTACRHEMSWENSVMIPRSISLQFRLRAMRVKTRRLFGVSDRFITCWPIMAMIVNKSRGAKGVLAPATKAELIERYRPSVGQLSDLLGRDLSHWLE